MTRSYRDISQYQLASPITNVATTLTLGTLLSGRGLSGLAAPFTLTIQDPSGSNREVVDVTSVASFPTLTITRAQNGTTAVAHVISPTNEIVTQVVGENDLSNFIQTGTAAGGSQIGGTYPNIILNQNGATTSQVMTWNGSVWGPAAPGGTSSYPADLASSATVLGWTVPPFYMANQAATLTSGTIYYSRIYVLTAGTVGFLNYATSNAGVTMTAGQNWGGPYNAAGTLIGQTADLSTAFLTTGVGTQALTVIGGQSLSLSANTFYYGAILSNATTTPAFMHTSAQSGAMMNFGFTTPTRVSMIQATQTTLPTSVTLSGLTSNSTYKWMALT